MDQEPESHIAEDLEKPVSRMGILFGRILIPALITVAGVLLAMLLFKTKPVTETAAPVRTARLVEAISIKPVSYQVEIEGMGIVEAREQTELKSRVSGEIIQLADDLIPGNYFPKGSLLFTIDPADYKLAVAVQTANVQQAEANMKLELGQQKIAQTDYEITGNSLEGSELDLVLRKPQLLQAQSTLASAQAALDSAKLNLDRTQVRAPFEALILEKNSSLGSVVTSSTTLATLVDASEFWVELSIPVSDVQWITENDKMEVSISDQLAWGPGVYRQGHVVGLSRKVDSSSRMAKVVVSVEDPLAIHAENKDKPALLVGSFVKGVIKGKQLDHVLVVSRDYLRQGDILWTLGKENRLVFTHAHVLFRGAEHVVIKYDSNDELRVVTSNLSVPVEGMLLRFDEGATVISESVETTSK